VVLWGGTGPPTPPISEHRAYAKNFRITPASNFSERLQTHMTAGDTLKKAILADLPKEWVLSHREEAILDMAAEQADLVDELKAAITKDGPLTLGSTRQVVLHPGIAEVRQARLAINRLIGELSLPDGEDEGKTAAGRRGQKAVRTRWDRKAATEALREGIANGTP
jgi:hypothetical protein